MSWAANLTVNFNGAALTGWRLPTTVDGLPYAWNAQVTGYNNTSSEIGYLYYVSLGNKAPYDTNGNYQPDGGLRNIGPFHYLGLPTSYYWSGSDFVHLLDLSSAVMFYFGDGFQGSWSKGATLGALAVRPGDVSAPVPIPGAVWLLGSGLIGLAGLRRRFKK
jgi:hypothetical protein